MSKEYPYTAWRLLTSYKPAEVVIVKEWHGTWRETLLMSDKGSYYSTRQIFDSREAAIAAGWKAIEKAEAAHAKQRALIDKRRAALEKAEKA